LTVSTHIAVLIMSGFSCSAFSGSLRGVGLEQIMVLVVHHIQPESIFLT